MKLEIPERYTRETGRDYALRTLKMNITSLLLEPGVMVSENELAAQMGLSRTPVREALIELSKVKIVEIWPQKGSAVSLIDYEMVEEAQFMRDTLECAVAELCCGMAEAEDVLRLKENIARQRMHAASGAASERFLRLDDSFHEMLFEIAKKSRVYSLMSSLAIHFDRVRSLTLEDINVKNVIQDHEEITAAVEAGDRAKARRVMQRHLNRFRVVEAQVREKYPGWFAGEPRGAGRREEDADQ